jgi:hypothetical protein
MRTYTAEVWLVNSRKSPTARKILFSDDSSVAREFSEDCCSVDWDAAGAAVDDVVDGVVVAINARKRISGPVFV